MEELLSFLKEKLNEVEGIDLVAIEAEIKKVVDLHEDEKQRLLNKNRELLKDITTAKNKTKTAEEKLEAIDVEEYERLKEEEENRVLNGGESSGGAKVNIDDIKSKIEKKYNAMLLKKDEEIKTLSESVKKKDDAINSTLIENTISKQLASGLNIRDEFKPMLMDYFKAKTFVEDDGFEKNIYIKDNNGSDTPVKTFFEYWGNSDEAKVYLRAEETSGAGTSGSNKFTKKKAFSEMNPSERVELYRKSPAEYERLKNEK